MGVLLLQFPGRDILGGDRHVLRLKGFGRPVRLRRTKSDFHLWAVARAEQLYVSPIRTARVKGSI